MKKITKLTWYNENDERKTVEVDDVRGQHDGYGVMLSKPMADRLLVKMLYWGLNSFAGESWGDAKCSATLEGGEEVAVYDFSFKVGSSRISVGALPMQFVERLTGDVRSVEFITK